MSKCNRELALTYIAALDTAAESGSSWAKAYSDLCWLEFEHRLEQCLIALRAREDEELLNAAPVAVVTEKPKAAQIEAKTKGQIGLFG